MLEIKTNFADCSQVAQIVYNHTNTLFLVAFFIVVGRWKYPYTKKSA